MALVRWYKGYSLMRPLPLVVWLFLLILLNIVDSQRTVRHKNASYVYFEDTTCEKFNHLTINEYTGQVYIGAVNKIYQLKPNLDLEAIAEMGPRDDSSSFASNCPHGSRNCHHSSSSSEPNGYSDYYNKALVIDYPQSRLIACGTLSQGACTVHKVENVTQFNSNFSESVVASDSSASTVAYIAPGPLKSARMHVLYVGASYSNDGSLPAIASRSLDPGSMFNIASIGVTTGTRLIVSTLAKEKFPITYVYGFASRGFSYFLTTQMKSSTGSSHFISKLVRICHKDINYYSYTEVPLVCRSTDGNDYNLAQSAYVGRPGSELAASLGITAQDEVLYVAFSKSLNGDHSKQPSKQSALCVYALSAIHRKFTQNIQHCFNGNGNQGLDFVTDSQPCVLTQVQIDDNFCGMDVNTPLAGSMPIEAAPVLTYSNTQLTSVAAVSTHDYTVAFLGTSDGRLKRAVIETVTSAFEFTEEKIDSTAINSDMHFNPSKEHLYAVTDKRVTMVKLQNCATHKSCADCLGAKNPYCGWCSLENKCSLRSKCAEATSDPLYWLSYKSGKCTTISRVHPPQIQRTTARTLSLFIENLPSLDGQFYCAFTAFSKTLITNANRSANGVTCPTPQTDLLPPIPPSSHHFTAKLSVRMKIGPDFVATNFTFYDCSSYISCTQCVSSPFPCDWCVGGHRCTHDTGENCRNDILVTGLSNDGPSIRSGPGFCPRINTTSSTSSEVLVPSGMQKRIQVRVDNIPQFILTTRFTCQFNIEGRVKQVNAQLLGDTVYCDQHKFHFTNTNAANLSVAFAVIWDGSKPLDNPENIHVMVYRCQGMADNCGVCLELPDKYNCGWCNDQCDVQEKCSEKSTTSFGMWLNKQQTCPDPQITNFYPKSGPFEGGTNITIEGINLGRSFKDIEDGVHIALMQNRQFLHQIPCIPFKDSYVKTSRITCRIHAAGDLTEIFKSYQVSPPAGHIVVKVLNEYTATSRELFSFVNPKISHIEPSRGPTSGGTRISIVGSHMDAGSLVEATLGPHPCRVFRRDKGRAECITSSRKSHGAEKLRVRFDNGVRVFEDYTFLYVEDPTITSVESANGQPKIPRGCPAGGMMIAVQGTNLNAVQRPMMYLELDGEMFNSSCVIESANDMKCKSPRIPDDKVRNYFPTSPEYSNSGETSEVIELDYGFIMDDVQGVRSLTRQSNKFTKFHLYPNPVYYQFTEPEGIKYYKSDYLTINGKNLDRATQEADVWVRIGTSFCNVTSLSRSQLTCRPPSSQPLALVDGRANSEQIPEVVVIVGEGLNYTIGRLSYESPRADGYSRPVLILIISASCILFLVVLVMLIAYRRKSARQFSRVLKSMQEQMDVLELKVASECKAAFAELQTEMTDISREMTAGGIPFIEYRIYCMKVLFPNNEDHPVLRQMAVDPCRKELLENGIKSFGHLILNKTFLLLFIRTLESNRFFSMRDRVNVASLIMVALQARMEYCTDILKTLLADLIEKCMESKSHPKLLLRRTESVAEKMLSSWFTFLLYKFLKDRAGEPMYRLFRAIKHQTEKGPIDSVTSEARYSLSEEKLIRQSIEFKALTVYVSMYSMPPHAAYLTGLESNDLGDYNETLTKVLDCDTISQVKEKALDTIYKNVPYSQRPCKDDLDLEWRTGQSGRLILSDEDTTSRTDGDWRRYNTLAHYKVSDGASLILVPKQSSMYNISILSEKMAEKHKYETLNFGFSKHSPSFSRPTSPLHHIHHQHGVNDLESGFKYWHLVKHPEHNDHKDGDRGSKMMSEIYLTRLLATKGTLQSFVDDLFETIFSVREDDRNDLTNRTTLTNCDVNRGASLPLAIKYMFDFLDDQALNHGITDPETVHTWKSNSLPLRFWVNLIKNPNFFFDINKSNTVDSCLSVVAQTFMDACSTSEHRLGKDSPSSKLLYAKEIPVYKDMVEHYYRDIQTMTAISDQEMNSMLAEESRQHAHEFNTNVALLQLYEYADKYFDQLIVTLEEDEFSCKNNLPHKLRQIRSIMLGNV